MTIASRGNNYIASIDEWGGGDDETKKKERDILNHFKNILPILENLTFPWYADESLPLEKPPVAITLIAFSLYRTVFHRELSSRNYLVGPLVSLSSNLT